MPLLSHFVVTQLETAKPKSHRSILGIGGGKKVCVQRLASAAACDFRCWPAPKTIITLRREGHYFADTQTSKHKQERG